MNRVNEVLKRQKRFSNVTEDGENILLGMLIAVTMELAVFMGKNHLNNCQSIVKTTDLTLKTNV